MTRTRAQRARRIAAAAAYGGGGVGALTGLVTGLLLAEARLARRVIGEPTGQAPSGDGIYGRYVGPPIRLAVLGDSAAAGLGVDDPHETPGVLLAAGLAEMAERPVELTNVAYVGARSADLDAQIDRVIDPLPDVVMVIIGANDVTHRVRPSTSVRLLGAALRRLTAASVPVVVGTCPDLGTIEPLTQPLRLVARRWSRELAAAQAIVAVEAGTTAVSLANLLGPEFAAEPGEMFGPDRFHPSSAGYASVAAAMMPSIAAALGLSATGDDAVEAFRGEGVLPVADAAAEASVAAGTEVSGTAVAGVEHGERGRWALLRRRRRRPLPEVAETSVGVAESS